MAIAATTAKYHRNNGINLDIRKTDSMIHKQPAYLLYVYLIAISLRFLFIEHQKKIKPYIT